jgi:hypothetical protein
MRLLRSQMPMRPEYIRATRRPMIPWVHDFGASSNTTVSGPPDSDIGDLAVIWAGNPSTSVIPTLAGGWTNIDSDTGDPTATVVARLAFRISTSVNQVMSGFIGANRIAGVVFKGARLENDGTMNGACLVTGAASAFFYPPLTLTGPSLIMLGHMPDDIEVHGWPAGFTQITSINSPTLAVAISDTEHTSWAGTSVAQTGGQLGVTFSLAVKGAMGQFR